MDVKHTRGEWKAVATNHGWQVHSDDEMFTTVCEVTGSSVNLGSSADARLIAAAPCLLEAGRKTDALLGEMQSAVVAYLQPGGDTPDALISRLIYLLDGPEQREAQGALRAAIARATEAPHD